VTTARTPVPSTIRSRLASYDETEKTIAAVAGLFIAIFIAAMLFLACSIPAPPSADAKRLLITHEAAFITSTSSRLANYSTKNQAPVYVQTALTEYNQAQAAQASDNGYPSSHHPGPAERRAPPTTPPPLPGPSSSEVVVKY
jgi:hypothetical protein